ncbi:MAG: hypothetical protein ACRC7O_13720, partial [Fimbriiglobus sp.]
GLPQPLPAADGKPALGSPLVVVGVAPGRAVVAGSVGRAWVAEVTFDPETRTAKARIVHEAREAQDGNDGGQWKSPLTAFQPTGVHLLRRPGQPDGGTERRVLIGRGPPEPGYGAENRGVYYHPLVFDPDRGTVGVMPGQLSGPLMDGAFGESDDGFYTTHGNHKLARVRLPKLELEPLPPTFARMVTYGRYLGYEGRLYVAELGESLEPPIHPKDLARTVTRWWVADADGKNTRTFAESPAGLRGSFFVSGHYGLCTLAGGDGWSAVSAVTVPPTPKK